MQGREVETRADGASGMAAAITCKPDIILLDIGLPDMDGYEVARHLRESGASEGITLIAVTGYGLPSDRIRSAEAGFHHHLIKPVEADELIRLIAGYSGRKCSVVYLGRVGSQPGSRTSGRPRRGGAPALTRSALIRCTKNSTTPCRCFLN